MLLDYYMVNTIKANPVSHQNVLLLCCPQQKTFFQQYFQNYASKIVRCLHLYGQFCVTSQMGANRIALYTAEKLFVRVGSQREQTISWPHKSHKPHKPHKLSYHFALLFAFKKDIVYRFSSSWKVNRSIVELNIKT